MSTMYPRAIFALALFVILYLSCSSKQCNCCNQTVQFQVLTELNCCVNSVLNVVGDVRKRG